MIVKMQIILPQKLGATVLSKDQIEFNMAICFITGIHVKHDINRIISLKVQQSHFYVRAGADPEIN